MDRALDARHCVYKGPLRAAFIHPLAELSEGYFKSGVEQVVALAENLGTTYNSGALIFRGGEQPEQSPGPKIWALYGLRNRRRIAVDRQSS